MGLPLNAIWMEALVHLLAYLATFAKEGNMIPGVNFCMFLKMHLKVPALPNTALHMLNTGSASLFFHITIREQDGWGTFTDVLEHLEAELSQ